MPAQSAQPTVSPSTQTTPGNPTTLQYNDPGIPATADAYDLGLPQTGGRGDGALNILLSISVLIFVTGIYLMLKGERHSERV